MSNADFFTVSLPSTASTTFLTEMSRSVIASAATLPLGLPDCFRFRFPCRVENALHQPAVGRSLLVLGSKKCDVPFSFFAGPFTSLIPAPFSNNISFLQVRAIKIAGHYLPRVLKFARSGPKGFRPLKAQERYSHQPPQHLSVFGHRCDTHMAGNIYWLEVRPKIALLPCLPYNVDGAFSKRCSPHETPTHTMAKRKCRARGIHPTR